MFHTQEKLILVQSSTGPETQEEDSMYFCTFFEPNKRVRQLVSVFNSSLNWLSIPRSSRPQYFLVKTQTFMSRQLSEWVWHELQGQLLLILCISGLVFTSQRAIKAVSSIKDVRSLLGGWKNHPVFVVGEGTLKILKKELDLDGKGSSAGNASALADIILESELQGCWRPHGLGFLCAVEPPFLINLGNKLFMPNTSTNLRLGLCQNQTENKCCGYKHSMFTLNLKLLMFFCNPVYMYFCIDFFFGGGTQKNLKNKLLLW